MWMLHNKVVLLIVVVFADEGSPSIESYLDRLVNQFGVEEAERQESKLNWIDYLHKQLPEAYMYSRTGRRTHHIYIHGHLRSGTRKTNGRAVSPNVRGRRNTCGRQREYIC
ncbi:uncharacterized protein LOC144169252 isoform X6 [Haemaphysalis longicornis]